MKEMERDTARQSECQRDEDKLERKEKVRETEREGEKPEIKITLNTIPFARTDVYSE